MTKSELRKIYKTKRKQISPQQLEDDSLAIANNLLGLDIWNLNFFHLFLPIQSKNEINTEPILNILSGKDKNIAIPKSDFKSRTFKNILLTDNTLLKLNEYGISEPIDGIEIPAEKFDLIFVPLLCFDRMGNRVGYGKGFYDRFLSECRNDALKIGLSQFDAVETITDANELDISLDYCITPREVVKIID